MPSFSRPLQLILTWQGRYHDQKVVHPGRGSAIALGCADPCEFPKCGNLDCIICGSGDCVRALPGFRVCKDKDVGVRERRSSLKCRASCACDFWLFQSWFTAASVQQEPPSARVLRLGMPSFSRPLQLILTWQGDTMIKKVVHPGRGSAIALGCADPCEFPKCGNLDCIICGSGDCVRALPWFSCKVVHPGRGSAIALGCADPCEFPKCGNLDCIICGSGDCVRALPWFSCVQRQRCRCPREAVILEVPCVVPLVTFGFFSRGSRLLQFSRSVLHKQIGCLASKLDYIFAFLGKLIVEVFLSTTTLYE
ncbi:hypothetical protein Q5P01_002368 [Channa striata]|uniref:Uncharacterized protein n=1 Tax=Channa striata TaxID=64152 RepID=A0AA88TDW8_CHASR|nr:hypothetical protein Q5P01_002368 [Channa striata]